MRVGLVAAPRCHARVAADSESADVLVSSESIIIATGRRAGGAGLLAPEPARLPFGRAGSCRPGAAPKAPPPF